MASFQDWTKRLKVRKLESPPFCWVILSVKGNKAFVLKEGLPIFEEWQDAQDFIDDMNIMECKPKLLYWEDVVKKVKGIVREIILDMGNGTYISFPPKL